MSETDEHEAMENEATEAHESLSAGASGQTLEHAIPGQATAESARADPDSEWVPSQETNEEQPSEEASLEEGATDALDALPASSAPDRPAWSKPAS